MQKLLLLIMVVLVSGCVSPNADKHNIPPINANISPAHLPICYNYGCSVIDVIQVSDLTWEKIRFLFPKEQSAAAERQAIRAAVAMLEQEAALHTPVGIDRGKNYNDVGAGSQDCLDESTNTTHFLLLLQNASLLQWHSVTSRAYRAHVFLDQHYAAQIIHTTTGQRYIVDSWYLDNGNKPYVQTYRRWALKKAFAPDGS